MIRRWFRRKEDRSIREEEQCSHDYSIVSEYKETEFNGYDVDFYDMVMLYCPKCDMKTRQYAKYGETMLRIQEVRKKYETGVIRNDSET